MKRQDQTLEGEVIRLDVRAPLRSELRSLASLFQHEFGFGDVDALPAWALMAGSEAGGVSLAAFNDEELVGGLHALPGFDGAQPFLYAVKIAVVPSQRGNDISRLLVDGLRCEARERGYRFIRGTTDMLSRQHLTLYLDHLQARVVGWKAKLFDGLLSSSVHGTVGDEVEIEFSVEDVSQAPDQVAAWRAPGPSLTETVIDSHDVRRIVTTREPGSEDRYCVEIPWNCRELRRSNPDVAEAWEGALRPIIVALVTNGLRGCGVTEDQRAQRGFVVFERAATTEGHGSDALD